MKTTTTKGTDYKTIFKFFSEAIFINFLNVPYMLQAHCCMNVFTLALCLTAHLFYVLPIQKRRRGCQTMR